MKTWVRISSDDYECGRWAINRLPADVNGYSTRDEWVLVDRVTGEAVDVFPRLRDAKAAVNVRPTRSDVIN